MNTDFVQCLTFVDRGNKAWLLRKDSSVIDRLSTKWPRPGPPYELIGNAAQPLHVEYNADHSERKISIGVIRFNKMQYPDREQLMQRLIANYESWTGRKDEIEDLGEYQWNVK